MGKDTIQSKKQHIIEIIEGINNEQVINFLFKYITKLKERC